MESWELLGWGVLFFKTLFFALVIGAVLLILHALLLAVVRPERARFARWIWVTIAAVYVIACVWMLVWQSETSFTVVAVGSAVMLATEVAYASRVVLPPRRREEKARKGKGAPTEAAEAPAEIVVGSPEGVAGPAGNPAAEIGPDDWASDVGSDSLGFSTGHSAAGFERGPDDPDPGESPHA